MKGLIGIVVGVGLACLPVVTEAKTCKCEQHDAEASGSGTCSRTETSSLCTITYTGSSTSSVAAANGFDISQMASLAQNDFDSRIPISETFRFLNQNHFAEIDEDEFRSVLINVLILLSPSERYAEGLIGSLDLDDGFLPNRGPVEEIFEEFRNTGCGDAVIGKAMGDDARFLIIHRLSEDDGLCSQ